MERKEFLSLVGFGSASILTAMCLGGCSKSGTVNGNVTAPTKVDFTIDVSLPAYASLATAGGYIYSSGIVIGHAISGGYIAVSQACTHQGVTVQYVGSGHQFYCPSHGATFSENGAVTGGPAGNALKQYQTTLTGTMLRIYS